MVSKLPVILGVAALLVLAGCVGTTTDTGAETTPTETGTEAGTGDEWSYSDPAESLRSAGSFTTGWMTETNDGEGTSAAEVREAVNLDSERSHSVITNIDGDEEFVMESFYADGTEYMRMVNTPGGTPFYTVTEGSFAGELLLYNRGYAYEPSDLDEWALQGTGTYDGVTVREYTYDGYESWMTAEAWLGDGDFDVTAVEFTMKVDKNGVARYQNLRIEAVDDDDSMRWVEWTYTVTDIGSTAVEDPEWLAEAEEQGGDY